MIGHSPIRAGKALAATLLTAGLVAGFFTRSGPVSASPLGQQQSSQLVVSFQANGATKDQPTGAATVGAFLQERGIVVGANDYVDPNPSTPVTDRMIISYRAAVPVTIAMHDGTRTVLSSADDVGALLEEQGIHLGAYDEVYPSLAQPVTAGQAVRVVRVLHWTRTREVPIAELTLHKIDFNLQPGSSRVVSLGHAGLREADIAYTQRDGGAIQRTVLSAQVVKKPAMRVVADGVDEYDAFTMLERRGLAKMALGEASAMQMLATAYTGDCYGCSGRTALGYRAGHGIVAVDPSVIPLGTRLYIPGYGTALAGDTGGDIHGFRIDLGFNSSYDALRFGRREVTVYRLK